MRIHVNSMNEAHEKKLLFGLLPDLLFFFVDKKNKRRWTNSLFVETIHQTSKTFIRDFKKKVLKQRSLYLQKKREKIKRTLLQNCSEKKKRTVHHLSQNNKLYSLRTLCAVSLYSEQFKVDMLKQKVKRIEK